jgi:predicted SprT family Zn-dependent metalloprotease
MDRSRARALTLELMEKWKLHGWHFAFNHRARACGLCNYTKKTVELSGPYVDLNDESEVLDTIKHEIAHALSGAKAGHGRVWRNWAKLVGANAERLAPKTVRMPKGAWQAHCPVCNARFDRHRAPAKRMKLYCGKCGPKAPLVFARVLMTDT